MWLRSGCLVTDLMSGGLQPDALSEGVDLQRHRTCDHVACSPADCPPKMENFLFEARLAPLASLVKAAFPLTTLVAASEKLNFPIRSCSVAWRSAI